MKPEINLRHEFGIERKADLKRLSRHTDMTIHRKALEEHFSWCH
jgi:hypothetical protein